jgi:GPH family glycoside/pentoside/hexuronide:cation symporter
MSQAKLTPPPPSPDVALNTTPALGLPALPRPSLPKLPALPSLPEVPSLADMPALQRLAESAEKLAESAEHLAHEAERLAQEAAPVKEVPTSVRLAYAAPSLAQALLGVPIFVYLPKFYTDSIGVPLGAMGTIFLVGRVLDALTDPFVGAWSDRLRGPQGRRRPFMRWGALPLALAAWALYAPPALSPQGSTAWFAAFFFVMFLGLSVVFVPYKALGPELTSDYDERTSVFAIREGMLMLGTLVAAASPALLTWALGLTSGEADQRTLFSTYAALAAPTMLLAAWLCVWKVKERPPGPTPAERFELWASVRQACKNRPFVALLAAYAAMALGSNIPAVLLPYYTTYVLGHDLSSALLGGYFLVGTLALPFWVKMARKIGKKAAWLWAMVANVLPFAPTLFLGAGDATLFSALVLAAGFGGVAVLALPTSLQADAIDYDELRTGQRREGLFVGLWSIVEKSAYALGVGLALPILDAVGYVPNQAQSPEVLTALRVLYVGVPCLCTLTAIALGLLYPITRARHQAIRDGLHAKAQGLPFEDPLHPGQAV